MSDDKLNSLPKCVYAWNTDDFESDGLACVVSLAALKNSRLQSTVSHPPILRSKFVQRTMIVQRTL